LHFFTANGRLILNVIPKGSKYNQDYFIDNLPPALNQVRIGNVRHKGMLTLMMHIDNSICHNGAKITEKMTLKRLGEHSIHHIQPIHQISAPVTSGHSEQLKE
jgi:hypothetical protein